MGHKLILSKYLIILFTLLLSNHLYSQIKQSAINQIQTLIDEKELRTESQRKLDSQLWYAIKQERGESITALVQNLSLNVQIDASKKVKVDIYVHSNSKLYQKIINVGGSIILNSLKNKIITAKIPLLKLEEIALLPDVIFISTADTPSVVSDKHLPESRSDSLGSKWETNNIKNESNIKNLTRSSVINELQNKLNISLIGSVTTEGDATHRSSEARQTYYMDGTGIKIGVISDSYNALGDAASNITAGDLPGTGNPNGYLTPVTVLSDINESDEGRAMLQIIHDIAPGAQLYFATAWPTQTDFEQAILDLQAAGCDIICDDIQYFFEAPFQDDIIAQAVNTVTEAGVLYFSSAGNSGNKIKGTSGVWEGDFVDGGTNNLLSGGTVHNYDNGLFNNEITQLGMYTNIILFWSDPYGGSSNDYDLFILNNDLTEVISSSTTLQNGTQPPRESIATSEVGQQIVIFKKTGASIRALRLMTIRGQLDINTNGQIYGHTAAADAFSIAATPADGPYPNPFNSGNTVESFSSDGPRRIFYSPIGDPLTPGNFLFSTNGGILRSKPDLTAADGVSTSLAGFNPFFGTSAAAPHAAGIAALLQSRVPNLTPSQIRNILTSNALDIESSSFDEISGHGIIQAYQSTQACCPEPDVFILNPSVSPTTVAAGNNVTAYFVEDNIGGTTCVPNYVKFYLSQNDILTPGQNGDIYLGQYFINQNIPPLSQTTLLNKTLTVPTSVATGTYYLFYWADGSEIVSECVEDNNFATAMLTVTGVTQLADLIIQNPSVLPISILPGASGTVYCKNKNQGVLAADASYTSVWLSQDQVYDGAPTDINLNADIAIPALDPGQTSTLLSEQITIPAGTECGPWYIMFGADALNEVPEGANEANNQDFIALNIPCPLLCDNDFACGPPAPPTLSISTSCNNTTCSTVGATPPSPEITYISCAGIPYQAGRYDDDVWFKIIPANSNQISITVNPITNLANFDPVVGLYIYNGSCPSLIQVGCADENGNELPETLVHTPTAGTTYLIRVFSYGMAPTNSGDFQICVQEALPQSGLFWVGNSGNWNDGSHWSISSGGTPCDCIPTLDDNVNFDANSFNGGGQSVNITQIAYCKSMNWTGAHSSAAFAGNYPLNIYGSLILNSTMNVTYTGQINFKSNDPSNNIQTFGKTLSSDIYFDALGGEWTLQDNLSMPNNSIFLTTGSFNTNGKTVSAYRFSCTSNGICLLTLGASTINVIGYNYQSYAWYLTGSNLTLNSGTSTINISGYNGYLYSPYTSTYYNVNFTDPSSSANLVCGSNSIFHDVSFAGVGNLSGLATYNNVSFLKDAYLNSTSTFNNLTLAPGKTYTFTSSNSFTINGIFSADGTCATPTQIFSSSQGSAATLSKSSGNVTVNYVRLRSMTASGGAIFTANNCTNFGNNNGWTINNPSPQNLYWVGNGGNWTDANHWSLSSGGTSSGCIPTPYNNVIFDGNSFNGGGQSVIVDQTAYCKSMDWTGALSSSTLAGSSSLNIYGSLILNPSMNVTYGGQINFKSNDPGNNIQTFGKTISSEIYFDALGGEWTLQDNLNMPNNSIFLTTGSFNTNGKTVSAYRFSCTSNGICLLTLGASTINVIGYNYQSYAWYLTGSNLTLNSGTSTINISGYNGYLYSPYTSTYYNVNFTDPSSSANLVCGSNSIFHDVSFAGVGNLSGLATYNNVSFLKDAYLNSTSTFNNLTLAPGKTYTFANGTNNTFLGNLIATGSPGNFITITGSSNFTTFTKSTGNICLDYITLQNVHAEGGAYFFAGVNSNNISGNIGWSFTSCSADPPDTPANPTSNSPQCNIVTLTSPGTPPTGVVWYWQGISCGTSTNLGSGPTFQATSSGTYYLRAYKPECSCWSSGCGSITVEVNETTDRMWTGTISTDWTNGNNWTCGTAPNPDNDVTIPSGTPFSPFLPNGISVWCKSLTLMPGAIVTIQPLARLNIVQY